MRNFILFLIALYFGIAMYGKPFPPKVNAFIVAVFVTLGIYKELKKLIDEESVEREP